MSKDLSFLKENKLFNWLLSCLPLAILGLIEYFFYGAFVHWTIWKVAVLGVASFLSAIVFAFWLGIRIVKKPTVKSSFLFTAAFAVGVCLICFAATTACHLTKNNASLSYLFGAGLADLALALSFVFGWVAPEKKSLKEGFIATCALFCALLIVASVYVGLYPKNEPMSSVIKDFQIQNNLPDGNGKEVKVILLNGQSNASGVSRVAYLSEEDRNKYKNGYENVLINYFCDNGNNTSSGYFTHAGLNQGYNYGFFGPELGLAEKLSEVEGETFIIIKYTWGGTILDTQWFAPKSDGSVGPLYRAFINFTTSCMDYLTAKGYNAKIGAMCWMQGESDSVDNDWTARYQQNTADFVSSLRKDLAKYTAEGGIRYIDAGISDSPYWTNYQSVNSSKKAYAADANNNAVYIDTIEAKLDYHVEPTEQPDYAHYDSYSEVKLGHLFAEEVLKRYNLQ